MSLYLENPLSFWNRLSCTLIYCQITRPFNWTRNGWAPEQRRTWLNGILYTTKLLCEISWRGLCNICMFTHSCKLTLTDFSKLLQASPDTSRLLRLVQTFQTFWDSYRFLRTSQDTLGLLQITPDYSTHIQTYPDSDAFILLQTLNLWNSWDIYDVLQTPSDFSRLLETPQDSSTLFHAPYEFTDSSKLLKTFSGSSRLLRTLQDLSIFTKTPPNSLKLLKTL